MIARALLAMGTAAIVATAPVQCGHDPDPAMRHEDGPGDALWDLAQKFREQRDDAAARETLQQLVQKYPSSRHAPEAREMLRAMGAGSDGG